MASAFAPGTGVVPPLPHTDMAVRSRGMFSSTRPIRKIESDIAQGRYLRKEKRGRGWIYTLTNGDFWVSFVDHDEVKLLELTTPDWY